MSKETPTVYYDERRVKQVRLDLSVEAQTSDVANFAPEGCEDIRCELEKTVFVATYYVKGLVIKRMVWPLFAIECVRVDYA